MALFDRGRRFAQRALGALRRRLAPTRPITCIGHSHLRCVQVYAATQGLELNGINFWATPNPFVVEDGRKRLRPDLADRLRRGPVFSFIGGGSHSVFVVTHPEPFDFVLPEAPDLPIDENARILPVAALREFLMVDMRQYFEIIDMVLAVTKKPMFHMESPPPFADGSLMAETINWPQYADRPHEVAPRFLRYKIWRLHSAMVREFCISRGITFIDHPRAATDAEGFLAAEYYHDCVHAGPAYGALLLDQMRSAG